MGEIDEMLGAIERWRRRGEDVAVATLVRASGSSPRLPGARLCVTRNGEMVGSISGGCVENDIAECGRRVLDRGKALIASYGVGDDAAFAVGLSCGGDIEVLIEPLAQATAWQQALLARGDGQPVALCTVLDGGAMLGRKLALISPGPSQRVLGSIDAEIDEGLLAEARALLPAGGTRELRVESRGQDLEVFVEAFARPRRLLIVGATALAAALCRVAAELGFAVSVIDPRAGRLSAQRFPEATDLIAEWPQEVLARSDLNEASCVVTVAHDSKFDVPTLACALRSATGYIGALGSRRTHSKRVAALKEQGFGDSELERIHSPVGLDIGGRSPQEIAVSIVAEILAVLAGRNGHVLSGRSAPIYGRH